MSENSPKYDEKINHLETINNKLICCCNPEHLNNDCLELIDIKNYYESRTIEYSTNDPKNHISINYDF